VTWLSMIPPWLYLVIGLSIGFVFGLLVCAGDIVQRDRRIQYLKDELRKTWKHTRNE
jgi:hypothetical protein